MKKVFPKAQGKKSYYTSLISSSLLSKCSLLVKYWKLLTHVISTRSFKKGTKKEKNMNAGQVAPPL
jgi:hypothetical protein